MEKIIEKIYDLQLKNESFSLDSINHESSMHEWELYCQICQNLPEDAKELFNKFLSLRNNRQSENLKNSYHLGFKTAIKLIMEAMKE